LPIAGLLIALSAPSPTIDPKGMGPPCDCILFVSTFPITNIGSEVNKALIFGIGEHIDQPVRPASTEPHASQTQGGRSLWYGTLG